MSDKQSYKAPPRLTDGISFDDWMQEVAIWRFSTEVKKEKIGAVLFNSLTGKSRDAAREIPTATICSDTGEDEILAKLDTLHLTDGTQKAFNAWQSFVTYKRPPETSIQDYMNEFDRRYHKLKSYKMELPEGVLACQALMCANMSSQQEQLARATCGDLILKNIKTPIMRIHAENPISKD